MGDYISEADISALKDTLCTQQNLLQKLYNELEAEREAAATAASEALSVILRLQGEKAAVKMEAEQYKRLSEEKISHAEESFAIIEDVIYQKEMEVATLDHQVQAYRYKLLSMGCVDPPNLGEREFPDDLVQRNEDLSAETSVGSIGRRNSAPVSFKCKSAINEREFCGVRETDLFSRIVEERKRLEMCDQASDSGKKSDDSSPRGITSYWDQIKKLDARVKEIAGANYMSLRSESHSLSSLSSRLSTENLCDLSLSSRNESSSCKPNKAATMNENDQIKSSVVRNGVAIDNSSSLSIHDVFEVPQVDENLSSFESKAKDENAAACKSSGSLEKGDVFHPEAIKMDVRDENWLKKLLQSTHINSKLCQSRDIDCNLVVFEPRMTNQVNTRSEIVEVEREAETESTNREEELRLLNEIKEKLDSLHNEIRSLKVKKCATTVEPLLSLLSEAMLHFWI